MLCLAALCSTDAHGQDASTAVLESDLTAEVDVRLLFLDVEVVDEAGNPIPGLTRDDFTVRLNTWPYPIETLDDLCGCAAEGARAGSVPPPSFVLYFDFSQLAPRGREAALREAERWVREVRRPEDLATVVAYSTAAGLRRLCPLTGDGDKLLDAIRAAAADPELVDPFPARLGARLERCMSGTLTCHNSGMREYWQTYRSSKVLLHVLARLDALPGRKVMLLFYQNNAIRPACLYAGDLACRALYDGNPPETVPNLKNELAELGGIAMATGTVIHPIASGPATDWSIDFGETLADATGGSFDRRASEIPGLIERAGRGCTCIYRIGLEPPPTSESRTLRVKVGVGEEHWLPHDYRLLQLTDEERWRLSAGAVLLDPAGARDIPVEATIVPQSATKKRWDVKVRVAIDAGSLAAVPGGAAHRASWEVGAVLVRQGGRGAVEMLGVSRVRCPEGGCRGTVIHERVVERLHPGRWELRAFAHDRWTDAYGGARAEIELPPPRASVVGPLIDSSKGPYVSADLPLWTKKSRPGDSIGIHERGTEPPTALSWICGQKNAAAPPAATRRLWAAGSPVLDFEEQIAGRTGRCWTVRDVVDPARLAPGRYDYELRPAPAAEPRRVSFEIDDVGPTPAAAVARVERGSPPSGATAADTAATFPEPRPAERPVIPIPPPVVQPERAPSLRPTSVELRELLDRLVRQAGAYRDTAFQFTCDETIVENRRGRTRTLEFEYIYAHDDHGKLRDYRLRRRDNRRARKGKGGALPVDLADSGLPAFVLRAYSSIFIFDREHRHLYDFELLGEEEVLERRAVKVGFEGVPPVVEDLNDWVGSAWVDPETHQLLRIRGRKTEDHRTKLIYDKGVAQDSTPANPRTHAYDELDAEFAVERGGIRFPSRVVIRRKAFETSDQADYLRTPARELFRIVQLYDNYRIFGVRTAESAEGVRE